MSSENVVLEKLPCHQNDAQHQFTYHYFDKQMMSPLTKAYYSIFNPFGNQELVAHCDEQYSHIGFLLGLFLIFQL